MSTYATSPESKDQLAELRKRADAAETQVERWRNAARDIAGRIARPPRGSEAEEYAIPLAIIAKERDEALRQLRALEWLLISESNEHRRSKGPVLVTVERLRGKVVVFMSDPSRPDLCRVTYADAADALGWDGKVPGG